MDFYNKKRTEIRFCSFLYYRKVRHRVIFNNKFKNTKNKKEAT